MRDCLVDAKVVKFLVTRIGLRVDGLNISGCVDDLLWRNVWCAI